MQRLLRRTIRNCRHSLQIPDFFVGPRLITIRSFADVKKSPSIPASKKYNKHKKLHKSSKSTKPELTYSQEADLYVLKELRKEINDFKYKNQNIKSIVSQFAEVLSLYGFKVVKSPIPHLDLYFEEAIHLCKEQDDLVFNLLIDYKISEIGSREIQLVVINKNNDKQLLYLLGDFTKDKGFMFSYAMVIDTTSFGSTPTKFSECLCSGDNTVFKRLNNHYQKELHVNDPKVVEFLTFNGNDYDLLPDMDGRLLVDTVINYMMIENLGVKAGAQDGDKLRAIIWMLGTYCENMLYGKWLSDIELFIKE